ncbi:hypothetical protein SAMN02745975_01112 [Geosporobacter subterraneus DSM 17957]|uniref:DRTGG domain-containing protein n=1 Tax=Geosporobacter subterraneus DSM 17957 TaxID=1121919 RepID=A0A1M6FW19_9FIRM|nr:hypothetical protein [Geosporobacter subterraneus]SHJ01896.1 hypothetical protein SAMN02745975_01112 [Geosporobacter subterraneus DSM 17957]
MKLSKVIEILNAELYSSFADLDMTFQYGKASDLLSDVLRFPAENSLLLTGLMNLQVVRTAEMLDIKGIVFVRDKKPSQEIIDLANQTGIVLMGTRFNLYKSCGLLYQYGLMD